MACFGGGSGAKSALNPTIDPQIALKPFLEVSFTLGNASRETVTLVSRNGDYLPGS